MMQEETRMPAFKKTLCLTLAILWIASAVSLLAGCAETEEPVETEKQTEAATSGDTAAVGESEAESDSVPADDRFTGVNYNGRKFRIHTSTRVATTGVAQSNLFIEGVEQSESSLVNDAVLERNIAVEELLGIQLEYHRSDLIHTEVPAEVRRITTAGDDDFDLIINDLYPFANLSIEGQFRNTLDPECVFDFERSYWYGDYMEDLRLLNGYQHLLAGDYFIDVLRSAHLLLLNKEIYNDYYQRNADEIYDFVTNYQWTYDKMYEIVSGVYKDVNANNEKDKGDQFGFISCTFWGGSIGYSISGNPTFIERDPDTGEPTVVLGQGDRANQLGNAMSRLFNSDASSIAMTDETQLLQAFANDECLILDYQRLGSLESSILRDMEGDACVLPYPLLFESDAKYTTAAHDTTEVGAILVTSSDLPFISTVVEVLNRESANILMPKYYKEGLQVQYVDDSKAAYMIDIIHDNFDNSFALAFNEALGQNLLQPFSIAMESKREFTAVYAKNDTKINQILEKRILPKYEQNNVK